MSKLPKGTYEATVMDYGEGVNVNGNLYARVDFVTDDETMEPVSWFGYMTDAAMENTMAALNLLNLNHGLLGDFGLGEVSGALDKEKRVSIVVDEYKNKKGFLESKVLWVNEIGAKKKKATSVTGGLLAAVNKAASTKSGAGDLDTIPFG